MRHRKLKGRLDKNKPERNALFRNIVRGLFISQRVETTVVRAKAARRMAERLITLAKKGDLHARRRAFAILRDEDLVSKLFKEIAPLFKDRLGGYTRIIHSGVRRGDNAKLVILELTEKKIVTPKVKPKKEKAAAAPKPAQKEIKEEREPKGTVAPEKHISHKAEEKKEEREEKIHPTPKKPSGFVGTLRKFFKGRTK